MRTTLSLGFTSDGCLNEDNTAHAKFVSEAHKHIKIHFMHSFKPCIKTEKNTMNDIIFKQITAGTEKQEIYLTSKATVICITSHLKVSGEVYK
jgi:hypothetical protein